MTDAGADWAQPFFLGSGEQARFGLFHPAGDSPRGAYLYLHPFAEEMNKARPMAARQARALAAQGYAVLQLDLCGCGDSAGDFGQARWDIWLDDVARGLDWLRQRLGPQVPLGLWGLRLGALLALDYAQAGKPGQPQPDSLLLWQPVTNGSAFLTQFLRLKVAGQMLSGADGKGGSTDALRATLASGQPLEVAGYTLAPVLASALDALDAAKMAPPPCPLCWLELAPTAGRALSPAAARLLAGWQEKAPALSVTTAVAAGPAFWVSQEISQAPDLIAATLNALQATHHAA